MHEVKCRWHYGDYYLLKIDNNIATIYNENGEFIRDIIMFNGYDDMFKLLKELLDEFGINTSNIAMEIKRIIRKQCAIITYSHRNFSIDGSMVYCNETVELLTK